MDDIPKEQYYYAYNKDFPELNEIVMVKIISYDDMNVHVILLEYGNKEAYIALSDITKKRIKSIGRHIKINNIEPVIVIRLDIEKNYIDCSRKNLLETDIEECNKRYNQNKFVYNIWSSLTHKIQISQELFYNNIVYYLNSKYNSAYIGLLSYNNGNEYLNIDNEIELELRKICNSKFLSNVKHYKYFIEITCTGIDGIDGIKECIIAMENSNNQIKIKYISSPVYCIEYQSSETIDNIIDSYEKCLAIGREKASQIKDCNILCRYKLEDVINKSEIDLINELKNNCVITEQHEDEYEE